MNVRNKPTLLGNHSTAGEPLVQKFLNAANRNHFTLVFTNGTQPLDISGVFIQIQYVKIGWLPNGAME